MSGDQKQATSLLSAEDYVLACFPTAQVREGIGYFCVQAATSSGTIWLGSAGTRNQAWSAVARSLDKGGDLAGYAPPSWADASKYLKRASV